MEPKIIQLMQRPDAQRELLGLDEQGNVWIQNVVPGNGYLARWVLWLPNNRERAK